MISISRAIIVEGKYDKIRLENIVDAVIITTNGFRIFKDIEKRELIRKIAQKKGLLVITDSDKAGSVIRGHLKSILPDADIINVYLPQIKGKERRKSKGGAEGLLGVEGTPDEIILSALKKFEIQKPKEQKIQKSDLFALGLSGIEQANERRKGLLNFLELPENLTANALLDALNSLYTFSEFMEVAKQWQQDWDKN